MGRGSLAVWGSKSGCFWPGTTGITVLVVSPVLAGREQAWMAVSKGVRRSTT